MSKSTFYPPTFSYREREKKKKKATNRSNRVIH